MTVATFPVERLWAGVDRFDAFVESPTSDPSGNPITYRDAERDLSDPSTYYGGPKDGRILAFGRYDISLSDRTGQLQGTTLSYTEADVDRRTRNAATNPNQVLSGVQQTIRGILESDRLAGKDPVVLFRGVSKAPSGAQPWTTKRVGVDWLSARIALNLKLPTVGSLFGGAPSANLSRTIPLWMGLFSDGPSGGVPGAPVITAESASGAGAPGSAVGAKWGNVPAGSAVAGFGSLAGVLPAPASLSPVEAPQGSGSPGNAFGSALNAEGAFHFQRWPYDSGGNEGDPIPFLPFDPSGKVSFTAGPSEADVSGASVVGASGYRTATGQQYDSPARYRWQQVIDSASTSVVFNQTPHSNVDLTSIDPLTLAAGATVATPPTRKIRCLTAQTASGETAPSGFWVDTESPYRRPRRGTCGPVTGALNYWLYSADWQEDGSVPAFTQRKSIPTTNVNGGGDIFWEDDLLGTGFVAVAGIGGVAGGGGPKGVLPGIDVGGPYPDLTSTTWDRLQVFACHPMSFTTLFSRDSSGNVTDLTSLIDSQITFPGASGYVARFGSALYLSVGGYFVAPVYVRGQLATDIASGKVTLFANAGGVEDVGDGTGTRIDSIYAQKRFLARNFAMADTQWSGGLFATTDPTWPDGASRIDAASFAALETAGAAALGDTTVAWGVTSVTRIADVLALAAFLGDLRFASTKGGALRGVLLPPNPIPAAPTATLTEGGEIGAGSFTFVLRDDPTWFYNRAAYSADPSWDASGSVSYRTTGTWTSAASIARYDVIDSQNSLAIPALMSATRQAALLNRILTRAGIQSAIATGTTHVNGLSIEIGDAILVQHREAPWAPLTPRLVQVEVLSPALSDLRVTIQGDDLDRYAETEFADMLAGVLWDFNGDEAVPITNSSYPSGAGGDKRHAGTNLWSVDAAALPGTYTFEANGYVDSGVTLTVGLFNLDDAPDTAIAECTITSTTRDRAVSATTLAAGSGFAAAGASKRYGIKVKSSAASAFACGVSVRRAS